MHRPSDKMISAVAKRGSSVRPAEVTHVVQSACSLEWYQGKRTLLIIPDNTRTAPIGSVFRPLYGHLGGIVSRLDVLVALGTHQPMSERAICDRLGITMEERRREYRSVRFYNHAWNDDSALATIGTITATEVRELTEGRFEMDVPIQINRRLLEYDRLIVIGPVFPHEVVGFSGGNKYFFPGVAGPQILNFFHWLGAVISTPKIIGRKWTPVRRVVDKAASLIGVPKTCFCLVVEGEELAGLFAGTPEEAWAAASDLSNDLHVVCHDRPYRTILACAPKMYDEIWTAGKCMYKLEPVLADGGELIIYAPHITEFSATHGKVIEQVGYHCRDYFLAQWARFKDYPWGVLAHSTHVFGLGTYSNGREIPRARVVLATGIPEARCRAVNLGYRDPASIRPEEFANREAEGVLLVPKAGEILHKLRNPPEWAR